MESCPIFGCRQLPAVTNLQQPLEWHACLSSGVSSEVLFTELAAMSSQAAF